MEKTIRVTGIGKVSIKPNITIINLDFSNVLPTYEDALKASTIDVSADIPMLDIDLSQLPKGDKPVAQTVAMNYLNENFIKRNSVNPKKVQNMIFIEK